MVTVAVTRNALTIEHNVDCEKKGGCKHKRSIDLLSCFFSGRTQEDRTVVNDPEIREIAEKG